MSFKNRREILFLYTVADANPNGDPLNQNHPRYDEDTEQVLVSDVRIKRTIRDQWVREGCNIFVDGTNKTLKSRFEELKSITGSRNGRDVLRQCLDSRLFGATFTLGSEAFSWTGPVQFKWGRSLHAVNFDMVQGTSAFASREGSQQRSFRSEYKVPFALIAVYAIANQYAASVTGAEDEDLDQLAQALWKGTNNLITRSKSEHQAVFYLGIQYCTGFDGKIGALEDKITLKSLEGREMDRERQQALRSTEQCRLDLTRLAEAIGQQQDHIQNISIMMKSGLHLDGLEEIQNRVSTQIEMR